MYQKTHFKMKKKTTEREKKVKMIAEEGFEGNEVRRKAIIPEPRGLSKQKGVLNASLMRRVAWPKIHFKVT